MSLKKSIFLAFTVISSALCALEIAREGECLNGIEFSVIFSPEASERVFQAQAAEECTRFEAGQFAPIFTLKEFERVLTFLNFADVNLGGRNRVWVGLVDDNSTGIQVAQDPLRFVSIDGREVDQNFRTINGEIPWDNDQPNTFTQKCVQITQNRFEDKDCERENERANVLCRQVCEVDTSLNDSLTDSSQVIGLMGVITWAVLIIWSTFVVRKSQKMIRSVELEGVGAFKKPEEQTIIKTFLN